VLNYELLDRHMGWLGDFDFRGMVVDEAHFIKNKASQRSQRVLALSDRIRSRAARPLLMALTGTPLINDIEDFLAIWQFLGWIDDSKPLGQLMNALEDTGLTPADRGFYAEARQCVIDLGVVRRRQIDVAAHIPARRLAAAIPFTARPLAVAGVPYGHLHAPGPGAAPGLFRLGDQAAVIPSLAGDGVAIALASAALAARAVLAGEPAEAYHRRLRAALDRPMRAAMLAHRAAGARRTQDWLVRACRLWPGLIGFTATRTRCYAGLTDS